MCVCLAVWSAHHTLCTVRPNIEGKAICRIQSVTHPAAARPQCHVTRASDPLDRRFESTGLQNLTQFPVPGIASVKIRSLPTLTHSSLVNGVGLSCVVSAATCSEDPTPVQVGLSEARVAL